MKVVVERDSHVLASTDPPTLNPTKSSLDSVRLARSHNEYLQDNDKTTGDGDKLTTDAEHGDPHKDGFEVDWDGESDPMNPKSWGLARKWMIVLICSVTSGCV